MKNLRIAIAILLTIFTIWYIIRGIEQSNKEQSIERFKNHSEIK